MKRVISGLGRIGRLVLRQCVERGMPVDGVIDPVMTRDELVYLLRHDSLYPPPSHDVSAGSDPDTVLIGGRPCILSTGMPFRAWLDKESPGLIMECSGHQSNIDEWRDWAESNPISGRHMVSTWLCRTPDIICIPGVTPPCEPLTNAVISAGTCTGNCVLPILNIIQNQFHVKGGFITVIHPYLSAQNLLDNPHRGMDISFSRSATLSLIPAKTHVLETMEAVFPGRSADFNAICHRVPVPAVMTVELNLVFATPLSQTTLIRCLEHAADNSLAGLIHVFYERLVSRDLVQSPWSAAVDAYSVTDNPHTLQKILLWQDNEWGYCCRVVDIISRLTEKEKQAPMTEK